MPVPISRYWVRLWIRLRRDAHSCQLRLAKAPKTPQGLLSSVWSAIAVIQQSSCHQNSETANKVFVSVGTACIPSISQNHGTKSVRKHTNTSARECRHENRNLQTEAIKLPSTNWFWIQNSGYWRRPTIVDHFSLCCTQTSKPNSRLAHHNPYQIHQHSVD